MKDQPKETGICGITENMTPAVVAGARLAYEQNTFDEWFDDVFVGKLDRRFDMIFLLPISSSSQRKLSC